MSDITYDLKHYTEPSTCAQYKWEDLDVQEEIGTAYERAVAHKEIIKLVLTGKNDISEVSDLVSQGIESKYALAETNEAAKEKEAENLLRYIRNENASQLNFKLNKRAVKVSVDSDGNNVYITAKPDAVRVDEANRTIEAIYYRSGSPTISMRTGIKENAIENLKEWFKLWVYEKYAHEYALDNVKMNKGDVYYIKASYYFMKKRDDNKLPRDNDFFSGKGGNIVTLEDKYIYGAAVETTSTDDIFRKFMESADGGCECTETDCNICKGRATCRYTKAPIKLEKKQLKAEGEKKIYSEAQLKVINSTEGIFKVNATAGSGKTECMTERSKRIIAEDVKNNVYPNVASRKLLHISFTDAAVCEMKERIIKKLKAEGINLFPGDIMCYTFNAFANHAIGQYYEELGFTKAPMILTEEYELDMIEKILNKNTISGIDPASVEFVGGARGQMIEKKTMISQRVFKIIKTNRIDLTDKNKAFDELVPLLRDAEIYFQMNDQTVRDLLDRYEEYDHIIKQENFVTYADQEPLMFKVLELHPEYFNTLKYEHIIVDEFQDSNLVQVETIKKLIDTPTFKSLMVVGDDSQAIYAFRDTTPEYIINFEKYLGKPVTELFLMENRRSTPEIVSFNNAINDLNENKVAKSMVSVRDHGKKPVVLGFYSKKEEYEYLSSKIIELVKSGVEPSDIAFIGYKKTELQEMGTLLAKADIPWIMKNPMNLMENSRIIAALSIADAFYQPEATILYFNYLSALYDGEILNHMTVEEINKKVADMRAEFENIYLLEIEEQREIFHRYLNAIKNVTEDELYDYFLEKVYDNEDLQSELEYTRIFKKYGSKVSKKMDQAYEGVVLTTAHSSKGLEWKYVFCTISNFDEKRMHPIRMTAKRAAAIEERRRLTFVAGTRAKDSLTITGQYVAYGPKDDRVYNQFLKELYDIVGGDYQPIDPMEEFKEAERKKANRDKYKAKKAVSSSPMTEEQKRAYDKLVAGAKQMTLAI